MDSKNIIQTVFLLIVLIILESCNKENRLVERISFLTVYKFDTEIQKKVNQDTVPWKYQISASEYDAKGDYKNALIQWDSVTGIRARSFTENQIDSINLKYRVVKASDYILKQARKNQVVIINEAHHNSFHRLFTKSLLKDLYKEGYTNFGVETLYNGNRVDSTLNERGYPILKSGYYIKNPQFADLVRTALNIGYNVFPYENTTNSNGKPREIEQAKNIQKVIETRPNEKFLIHCGFDHVLEGKHKQWEKAMAGRLTEYTGINPLTINQVVYTERSKPEYNSPFLKAINISESSVILDEQNKPYGYKRGDAWTDIAIFHPNTMYINNRPNWLFKNGSKNVPIELKDIDIKYPILVLAFKDKEDINLAVPVDIIEVASKKDDCNLVLKKGIYKIVVTNGYDAYKFEQKVK